LKRWADQSETDAEQACLHEMIDQEQQQRAEAHAHFFQWWNGDREQQLRQGLLRMVLE
jgi:hypothetical protein